MSALRLLTAPVAAAVVLLGIWISGGLLTNDFALAMRLTGAWIVLAGVVAVAIAVRSRALRRPVLTGYGVTVVLVGAFLASSTLMDTVVDEEVAVAAPPPAAAPAPRPGKGAPETPAPKPTPAPANELLGRGTFEPVRHAARGVAQTIRLADGGRVLTLTDFEVDNGPDLRVYLVAGPAASEGDVRDVVDLGRLRGNRGNQQYELPPSVDLDRYTTVVVWCRAFSVLFARAALES